MINDTDHLMKNPMGKTAQQLANAYARTQGYGKATSVVLGSEYKIIERVHNGYRKNTTNQYVPNAYLRNYGWKNTYYQNAITVVMVDKNDVRLKDMWCN